MFFFPLHQVDPHVKGVQSPVSSTNKNNTRILFLTENGKNRPKFLCFKTNQNKPIDLRSKLAISEVGVSPPSMRVFLHVSCVCKLTVMHCTFRHTWLNTLPGNYVRYCHLLKAHVIGIIFSMLSTYPCSSF